MQVEPEDRLSSDDRSQSLPWLPIAAGILIVILAIAWFFTPEEKQEPESAAETLQAATVKATRVQRPSAPDIPQAKATAPAQTATEELPVAAPPPPRLSLDESDPVVREVSAASLDNTVFAQALLQEDLLERSAALFEAAGNGAVLRKVFPIPQPEGKFQATRVDGQLLTDPQSHRRYDPYAAAIASLDTAALAAAFHRFRPLLEEAYANLGFRAEDMDNALIAALDQVLAAPVLEKPAELVADVNTYTYRDQSLEDLTPLAKQLLRMGPRNQALIQEQAKSLRAALLQE